MYEARGVGLKFAVIYSVLAASEAKILRCDFIMVLNVFTVSIMIGTGVERSCLVDCACDDSKYIFNEITLKVAIINQMPSLFMECGIV